MNADVAQRECGNNKCYALVFSIIYILWDVKRSLISWNSSFSLLLWFDLPTIFGTCHQQLLMPLLCTKLTHSPTTIIENEKSQSGKKSILTTLVFFPFFQHMKLKLYTCNNKMYKIFFFLT